MLASRFQTKKSLSNQKFAIYNVKNEVSFHLFKYQPWYKTLQIATNHKLKAVCLFIVLLLSTFCSFSIFVAHIAFAFAFGNFAHYCVVLLSALLSNQDIEKKKFLQWVTFPGKSWPFVFDARRSHWFVVSGDRIFSWHNASCLQTFLSWNLAFDFGRNTTTLSKFVGYMDLTNFRQISPGMMTNETVLGNFDKYLSHGVHWGNTPCIFFSYSNFRCWYLDNLSEYRKNPPHFRWLMPC